MVTPPLRTSCFRNFSTESCRTNCFVFREAGCRRNSTETRLRSLILKSVNTSCVTYQLAPPCPPRTSREGLPYLRPEPSPPGALSRPRPPRKRRAPMRGQPALVHIFSGQHLVLSRLPHIVGARRRASDASNSSQG